MGAAVMAALFLSGCGIPVAGWAVIATAASAGATISLNAYHDCRMDGGCKAIPLPP
jgi:hypothetical protein